MAGYSKEMLVDAFVSRYKSLGPEQEDFLRNLANATYDKVGRDEFRKCASLDAEAIRVYKAQQKAFK